MSEFGETADEKAVCEENALQSAATRFFVLASMNLIGAVREQNTEGNHGMSLGKRTQSPESPGDLLGDVLLPGRSVNVSDHTLHHPLDTLVHPVPVEKQ